MFHLPKEEFENWRSSIVTSNPAAKMGFRYPPYAFTEHGVAMLFSVLRSQSAVAVNIKLRQLLATREQISNRLDQPEWREKSVTAGSNTSSTPSNASSQTPNRNPNAASDF